LIHQVKIFYNKNKIKGSLTGGAKSKLENSKLLKLIQLNEKKTELKKKEEELNNILNQIKELEIIRNEYKKLTSELDMKNREFENISNQLKSSKKNEILEDINNINEEIKNINEIIEKNKEEEKNLIKKCEQIEKDMNNFSNHKGLKIFY
jgi:structural maintenance of chromosome 2